MIDNLIERFGRIPGARVGHGPLHPTHPAPAAGARLDEFLADYPFLRNDDTYDEFLRKYSGGYIQNEDVSQIVDILGFSEISTDIVDMEGPVVNRNGYLIFAQCIYHILDDGRLLDTQEHDLAFDATGERKPGVYRLYSDFEHSENEFEWQHPSFADWLADLVEQNGRLKPPTQK